MDKNLAEVMIVVVDVVALVVVYSKETLAILNLFRALQLSCYSSAVAAAMLHCNRYYCHLDDAYDERYRGPTRRGCFVQVHRG